MNAGGMPLCGKYVINIFFENMRGRVMGVATLGYLLACLFARFCCLLCIIRNQRFFVRTYTWLLACLLICLSACVGVSLGLTAGFPAVTVALRESFGWKKTYVYRLLFNA